MTYTRDRDQVTLEMQIEEFESLLLTLGIMAGTANGRGEEALFWRLIRLVNEINRTNPHFVRYEIPEGR